VYLDEEAVEMMLARGTHLVPTLVAPRGVVAAAEAGVAIPEESVRKARDVVAAHEASFRLAVSAGVPVAMGTDAGVVPHGTNLAEVVLMHELGMDRAAALRSATSGAAALLGLDQAVGALEPGKAADVVLVDGDPLTDLTDLPNRVRGVWRDGVAMTDDRG
jgi:imidazolonepropionase-like amidohydrolase